jgi:hypothetical protein
MVFLNPCLLVMAFVILKKQYSVIGTGISHALYTAFHIASTVFLGIKEAQCVLL